MNISEIFAKDLRGKDYIQARGLSPETVRLIGHTCPSCRQLELLPVIQNIVNGYKKWNG